MICSGSKAAVFECSMAPPWVVPSMILASRRFPPVGEGPDRFLDTPPIYSQPTHAYSDFRKTCLIQPFQAP
jgi:hypothetical protein